MKPLPKYRRLHNSRGYRAGKDENGKRKIKIKSNRLPRHEERPRVKRFGFPDALPNCTPGTLATCDPKVQLDWVADRLRHWEEIYIGLRRIPNREKSSPHFAALSRPGAGVFLKAVELVSAVVTAQACGSYGVPRVHVEIIYAYELQELPDVDPQVVSKLLEDGLAETLVEYKEYAGRMSSDSNGRPVIALDGQGAAWFDAEANIAWRDLMPFPPGHDILQLVPPNRGAEELLLVQFTRFTCGGFTLGIARHHQVADGEGVGMFMDAWVSAVRQQIGTVLGIARHLQEAEGDGVGKFTDRGVSAVRRKSIQSPLHDRSALMARDPPQPTFEHVEYKRPPPLPEADQPVDYPPLSIKKLHFTKELLDKLKTEAMKDLEEGSYFTTFESLAAHLWRCITRARGLTGEVRSKAIVAVNGRTRLEKKLPDNYFGNVIFHACAESCVGDLTEKPLSYAAGIMRKSIRRVDNEYILSALDFVEIRQQHPGPVARTHRTVLSPNVSITSWVQQPLYKTDFGWGAPLFVGPPLVPFEGLLILIPSHTQDGSIDAVTGLFAPDMEKLESYAFEI
ncbi:hypothetical protein R1flu_017340 [Riccia fluitans]|uniref:Uncharacterized protein n=1 Tax=Riccia fluitans TaxID=41844 RepID=A0ABD1ZCW1_9MARC